MQVLLAALISLSACGQDHRGPDQPVSSSTGGGPAAAIRTGVKGRVTTPEGVPIAGAVFVPESSDHPAQAIPEMAAVSNERGEYQWPLPPGRYTMSVNAEGYRSQVSPVEVQRGQLATLNFTLKPVR